MNNQCMVRKNYVYKILDDYTMRNNSQTDLSIAYNIPIKYVRRLLQDFDYHHTIHYRGDRYDGKYSFHPVVFWDEYAFIDRYIG